MSTLSVTNIEGVGQLTLDNVTTSGNVTSNNVTITNNLTIGSNTVSSFGKTLIDDADAAAARTTLGLGTIATSAAPSGTVVGTTDTQTLTNKTLTTPTIIGTVVEDVYALSGTSVSLEPDNGSIQTHSLGGSTTYTDGFSAGQAITLMITDNGNTITWPTITWVNNGGSPPDLSTPNLTVVTLWKISTTLYGALVGDGS